MNGVWRPPSHSALSRHLSLRQVLLLNRKFRRPGSSRDAPLTAATWLLYRSGQVALLVRLAQIRRPILKLGELVQEHQFDLSHRAVALFGQKQLRLSAQTLVLRPIHLFPEIGRASCRERV